MERVILFFFGLLCSLTSLIAKEEFSFKYGKVLPEELTFSAHPSDSTAEAMYIFKNCEMKYVYNNGFSLNYEIEVKIKVFGDKGIQYADIAIPMYDDESVTNISATTYNMEAGKTVKTKLDRKYIFEEQLNKSVKQKKFSIPAVKEGSVFEYKYTLHTQDIRPRIWMMQQSIPVKSSQLDFTFPEYFIFNIDVRGGIRPICNSQTITTSYQLFSNNDRTQNHSCNATHNLYKATDLPALRDDEPFLWYADDYKTQISFELKASNFPGSGYRSYATTWNNIDETLLNDSDFGKSLSMKNPYADEMSSLKLEELLFQDKVKQVFDFVKGKMSWNKNFQLIPYDIKQSIKDGRGSNADINMVLMAALRDADIASVPVLMSRRDRGILPFAIPAISALNTFVVCVEHDDKLHYIDGSMDQCWLNALASNLRADRGRILNLASKIRNEKLQSNYRKIISLTNNGWVNLQAVSRPSIIYQISATLSPDNKIEGKCAGVFTDAIGLSENKEYREAKDSITFIEEMEKDIKLKINAYNHTLQPTRLITSFEFESDVDMVNENTIYINPHIFAHLTNNQFKQEVRELPIEFPYLFSYRKIVTLNIPEGYEVEELPQNIRFNMDDSGCECSYLINNNQRQIILNYNYKINQVFFGKEKYDELKQFYGFLADKNNEMIILRKVQL